MTRRVIDLRGGASPLLDIASYGCSPGRPISPAARVHIALTARRAPEVMVKVSGGARSLRGVRAHLSYIGRKGRLGVETDEGQRFARKNFEKSLVLDWDLDLETHRLQNARSVRDRRKPFKLVHNLIFSMPPGTPPEKLVKAVRMFALNEFALKHRYAFTLHTDEPHPHVHLVVKAMSEQGQRLNIRKATLRNWRQQFATHLREQGVGANATERAVRGQSRTPTPDGLFRAVQRNASVHGDLILDEMKTNPAHAVMRNERSRAVLKHTREQVVAGWHSVADRLHDQGDHGLAEDVRSFIDRLKPVRSSLEQLLDDFRLRSRARKVEPLGRSR
jgi:hypothetical protein